MSPLVDLVVGRMLRNVDLGNSRVFEDDEAVAIQLQSSRNVIPVLFVFWLDDNRFSLFVEDKEVVDEFYKDESEIQKTIVWLETMLSREIHRKRFTRSGKVRKVIYTYSAITEHGNIEKYEDESVLGLSMPWHRIEKSEHLFEAWIVSDEK